MKHIPGIDFIGGKRYYFRQLFEQYPFQSEVRERMQERYRADVATKKAPFGCKSIVARAKHWMVPIS